MPHHTSHETAGTILIVGASRGLGLAMADEFLKKGWRVIGTVRDRTVKTGLHALAETAQDRLEIEELDINVPEQITALDERLSGRVLDMLFVNSGVTNEGGKTIGTVTLQEFHHVMTTNAFSPMQVIERMEHLVPAGGLIGVMSSGRGSLTNNLAGQEELYRGSKAAVNMFMRSFAARHAQAGRAMVLMAPGWVRTDLGGPDGRLGIEESVPNLVNVLLDKHHRPGLEHLDYLGRVVPW